MVPLLSANEAPIPSRHLNPSFRIGGIDVVMVTQSLAAVHRSELRIALTSLQTERDRIMRALDVLLHDA